MIPTETVINGRNQRKSLIYVGDVMEVLPTLKDKSAQCCVTSPPYWGLRDYGTAKWVGGDPECNHKEAVQEEVGRGVKRVCDKSGLTNSKLQKEQERSRRALKIGKCVRCGANKIDKQLGNEKTPKEYVDNMVAVFREVRRVLRDDGTFWLNIGDCYSGGRKGSNQGVGSRILSAAQQEGLRESMKNKVRPKVAYLAEGNLVGVPWMLAFALQADGWVLRQEIIWHKKSCMPESVSSRCTKAHEQIFLFTKSMNYYYDAEAIKTDAEPSRMTVTEHTSSYRQAIGAGIKPSGNGVLGAIGNVITRANKRSVWSMSMEGFEDSHFAAFPSDLPRTCILAGTSEKGMCRKCGAPWKRIVERVGESQGAEAQKELVKKYRGSPYEDGGSGLYGGQLSEAYKDGMPEMRTVGWEPTCNCKAGKPVPCVVLEPFLGSGTSLQTANYLGRDGVGIELNPEYVAMAEKRIKTPPRFDLQQRDESKFRDPYKGLLEPFPLEDDNG